MRLISMFLCALLFGLGLLVSGMGNPAKVANFLDLAGAWDPSLAFVMGGAILVALPGYLLAQKRARPVLEERFSMPTATAIDRRLIVGAAIFGIGWGLAGLCPGPALTLTFIGGREALLFLAAMFAGIVVARDILPKNLLK
jgi:hypothetical protein